MQTKEAIWRLGKALGLAASANAHGAPHPQIGALYTLASEAAAPLAVSVPPLPPPIQEEPLAAAAAYLEAAGAALAAELSRRYDPAHAALLRAALALQILYLCYAPSGVELAALGRALEGYAADAGLPGADCLSLADKLARGAPFDEIHAAARALEDGVAARLAAEAAPAPKPPPVFVVKVPKRAPAAPEEAAAGYHARSLRYRGLIRGGEARETVRLRRQGRALLVEVRLDGRLTAPLVYDTGATRTCISEELASRMGLLLLGARSLPVETANGTASALLVALSAIEVGAARIEGPVDVAVLPDLGGSEGLLGLDFSGAFITELDPEAMTLTLRMR